MNRYLVRTLAGSTIDVDAHDFTFDVAVVVFRDEIGRAIKLVPIDVIESVDCSYEATEFFELRRLVVDLERAAALDALRQQTRPQGATP